MCAHLAGLGRFRVLYTFHENPVRIEGAEGFRVDLATGEGLAALTLAAAPAFIVNLAAVSQPRRCEANPAAAASVNAPTVMSSWQASLDEAHRARLLVHVSTDQVYGDSKPPPALYVEADPAEPVNAYGRSKLAAERLLAEGRAFAGDWVALRSSVIFGPEPPAAPVNRGLFLQVQKHRHVGTSAWPVADAGGVAGTSGWTRPFGRPARGRRRRTAVRAERADPRVGPRSPVGWD